jgi:uncharacterized membrane protein YeaQ/YmgE (transglycosylase-associated protein family)
MLELLIPDLPLIFAGIIFSFIGPLLKDHIYVPFVKETVQRTNANRIVRSLIGAALYLFLIYAGTIAIKETVLASGLINKDNIDIIAVVSFLVFAVSLELRYGISGDQTPLIKR